MWMGEVNPQLDRSRIEQVETVAMVAERWRW